LATYIIGLDEAGCGAAIGPLVVTAIAIKVEDIFILQQLQIKDSKLFHSGFKGRRARARSYYELQDIVTPQYISCCQISSNDISKYMMDGERLDDIELSVAKSALFNLYYSLKENDTIQQIMLDGEQQFRNFNAPTFNGLYPIIIEDKADLNHIEVAAASIVSKHIRDRDTKSIMGEAFDKGAGYPNKFTKEWIENYPELAAPYLRYSWKWCNKLNKKTQKIIKEILIRSK